MWCTCCRSRFLKALHAGAHETPLTPNAYCKQSYRRVPVPSGKQAAHATQAASWQPACPGSCWMCMLRLCSRCYSQHAAQPDASLAAFALAAAALAAASLAAASLRSRLASQMTFRPAASSLSTTASVSASGGGCIFSSGYLQPAAAGQGAAISRCWRCCLIMPKSRTLRTCNQLCCCQRGNPTAAALLKEKQARGNRHDCLLYLKGYSLDSQCMPLVDS